MALWGKTDEEDSIPKFINLDNYPTGTRIVFVDAEEAQIEENRARGLKSPGWWLFREWEDSEGNPRIYAELKVAISNAERADTGDNVDDDDIVENPVVLTITTQPADVEAEADSNVQFTIVVTPTTGTSYNWQVSEDEGVTWTDIGEGGTSATLDVVASAENDGNQYRCEVTNVDVEDPVISEVATLTIAA